MASSQTQHGGSYNGLDDLVIGGGPSSKLEQFASGYPQTARYVREPKVFKDFVESLVRLIFHQRPAPSGLRAFDQCGEVLLAQLSFAIRHTPPAAGPPLSGSYFISNNLIRNQSGAFSTATTSHFRIYADQSILATDPGSVLEELYAAYEADFGKAPLLPPKAGRIDVVFCQLGRVRGMTAPDWPILLNEDFWNQFPDLRRSLAAHELFHRVEYAFGFRGEVAAKDSNPNPRSAWFSEGAASWAECTYNNCVTTAQKILALGDHPQIGLLNSSYYSCPVWLMRTGKSKAEMRTILEAYDALPEPDRATDAFTGGIDVHTRYLAYLNSALAKNGKSSGVRGLTGHVLKSLKTGILPKAIDLNGIALPFRTSATVNLHASELYRVDGPHVGLAASASAGVDVSIFEITRPQPGPMHTASASPLHYPPFLIAVTGNCSESQEFTMTIDTTAASRRRARPRVPAVSAATVVAEGYSYQMDWFGNVLIVGQGCKAALGFQLGPYPSFGGEDPAAPAGNLDWWIPGDPADPAGVTVRTRRGFRPSPTEASVTRTVAQTKSASGGTELLVRTIVTVKHDSAFQSLILSSDENATVDGTLSFDGMGSKEVDPSSSDNDGDSKPLWLAEITLDGHSLLPEDPIVPYPGKIWIPVPTLTTGTHVIVERYRLAAMLQ